METIIIVSGLSGVGKSTVAEVIDNYYSFSDRFKFASRVKRAVEKALGLPLFSIDSSESAKQKALPLLLEAYDKAEWVQLNLWAPAVVNSLKDYKGVAIFDDVRRKGELELLSKIENTEFRFFHVTSDHRGTQLSSDPDLKTYISWVASVFNEFTLDLILNNGTMEELARDVYTRLTDNEHHNW